MTPSRLAAPILVLALATGVACSKGDDNGPTGPSGIPTLVSISVTPNTDLIKIKAVETFTVTASFSDGTSQVVQGTWGSDAPGVATADAGRVTGVAAGTATIFADYQGFRATRAIRVVPDYHGRWDGDWAVGSCTGDGDFIDLCSEYATGELFGLTLVANQNRDAITGTTDFGDNLPGPVTGTIQPNGHLVVSGTYTISVDDVTMELTVGEWDTTTTDNQRMTGHLAVTGRAVGVQGSFKIAGDLHVVAKTSSVPAAVRGPNGSLLGRVRAALRRR